MKAFDKLCKVLDTVCGIITVVLMIFITIMIVASVIMRFLGNPLQWSYEATLVCMSWTTFLGMAITFRLDEHLRLTFVSNAMPPKVRYIFIAVLDILVILFLAYAGYLSIGVIKTAAGTVYQTIPVSRGWFYLPFPFGCVCSICQIINVNYKRLTGADTAEEGGEPV